MKWMLLGVLGLVVLSAACGGEDAIPCSGYWRETLYLYDEDGNIYEESEDVCLEGVLADGPGDWCLVLPPGFHDEITVDDVGCEPGERIPVY